MSAIFQVYGLTDAKGAQSWRALNRLAADAMPEGGGRGRMQIMRVGNWKGHPSGPLRITPEYLESIVAQFDAQANPMPVDYDHSAPKRGDTRAAGWIHALAIEGDWLWATDVEWTPAAAESIRAKEYQFNSPWWADDTEDRVSGEPTGPRMFNVALTNLPFFDGQQAITCSALTAAEPGEPNETPTPSQEATPMDEFLAAVAKSSGLTPEAVASALPAMADQIGAMLRDATKAAEDPPADDAPPPDDKTLSAADAAKIASEAKLNGLIASVAALTAAEERRAKAELDAKTAAETKLAAERTERIATMVRDGRLKTAEQDDAAKLLAYDATLFESTYRDRKPTVPINVVQAGPEKRVATDDGVTFTAAEQAAFKSLQGAGYSPKKARERVIATRAS